MPITGAYLVEGHASGGILQLALFPDLANQAAIEALLQLHVDAGYGYAAAVVPALSSDDQDLAARYYGYWQAYERRLEQVAGHGRGSVELHQQFAVSTTGDQIKELRIKADYWRGLFRALVPEGSDSAAASTRATAASQQTPLRFSW